MKSFGVFACTLLFVGSSWAETIRVTSKTFTESYILSEIVAQIIEDTGEASAERMFGLGGTGITYQAISNNEIDLYTDYTGTIAEEILKKPHLDNVEAIRRELEATTDLTISDSLGFNNTYAIAIRREYAKKHNIETISDLKDHQHLQTAIAIEFNTRKDGFINMQKRYGLELQNVSPMEHALAYESFARGKADMIAVYTTDAKITKMNLKLLKDDLGFFPIYKPVIMVRKEITKKYPKTWNALKDKLVEQIDAAQMTRLNAMAEIDGKSEGQIAAAYLGKSFKSDDGARWRKFVKRTYEHIAIVFISLFFSALVGVPLGVWAFHSQKFSQPILLVTGLMQTVPSLALLCFLIPLLGTGLQPTLMALFLYGLLPIVRNTHAGLSSIDGELIDAAQAINLTPRQQLRWVKLPLASINIMAGVKTSAVINVGTATIAALIGAGGYGAYIIEGLTRNDMNIILQGAIPAAGLAIIMHGMFEVLDRIFIPKGLRLSA